MNFFRTTDTTDTTDTTIWKPGLKKANVCPDIKYNDLKKVVVDSGTCDIFEVQK